MSRKRSKTTNPLPPGQRVLALDIASSVGYVFGVADEATPITWGKFASDTDNQMGKRLLKFSQWLSKTINGLPERPDIVLIEQPYLGRNVNTFAVLNRYIGAAQREVYRILKIEAILISPRTVKVTLKMPKASSHPQHKKNMVRVINRIFKTNFKYVNSRTKKAKRSDDDIADAFALFLCYCIKHGFQLDEAV